MAARHPQSTHQRFFALAALIRNLYSLHGYDADESGFFADGDKLTLGARLFHDGNSDCGWVLTDEMLTGDLDGLARTFLRDIRLGDKADSWLRTTRGGERATQPGDQDLSLMTN